MIIEIPLSQNGRKHAGLYIATIDKQYEFLAERHWNVLISKKTQYAYYTERVNGKSASTMLHRVILGLILGYELKSVELVDHIDGNGLNNCSENLRIATRSQNAMNTDAHVTNKSGIKGVHWDIQTSKWRAAIKVNGKHIKLGRFSDIEDARQARVNAEIFYFKEFAKIK